MGRRLAPAPHAPGIRRAGDPSAGPGGQESRSARRDFDLAFLHTAGLTAAPKAERKAVGRMPAKNSDTGTDGFSAEERAAMKERAAELRAEGKKGAKKADGLQAVLDKIAEMAPEDRALAERVHVTVTAVAPELSPKTWYGMPAYANADDKLVVFFQDSGKFKYRYSTLGFQEAASLDDGDLWPVSYAIQAWSPEVEKRVAELVKAAIS
jgi:uncharacterized protein YdhG (YjbR/CyaY superfamily)